MRLRPFALTCLLTFSVRQCRAMEGAADFARAAKEPTGAAEGIPAARSNPIIEHPQLHEDTTLRQKDRPVFSELRSPTTGPLSGEDSSQVMRYRGEPHSGGPNRGPHEGGNIYDELDKVIPHASMNDWMLDSVHFQLPRYPPEDEWRIKTWWIEKWRPLSRKLGSGIGKFFSVLFWPFHFIKPQELKYSPIPLHGLPHQPTPVWEKLPSGIKDSKGTGSWKSWVKNRLGIKSKKEPFENNLDDETVPILKNPDEHTGPPPQSKWKIPEFPPVSVPDTELMRQSYLLGEFYRKIQDSPQLNEEIDKLMGLVINAKTFTGTMSEHDLEKLKSLLSSKEHLELLGTLYDKRTKLFNLHKGLQEVLNKVVDDLGGEKNTRDTFREIIQYHKKIIENPVSQDAKLSKSEFLRMKYPKAYEMHLAPLILLEDVLRAAGQDVPFGIRTASGYIGDESRLERLIKPAQIATEYAQLVHQVDQIQNKVMEVRNFASSLTVADFADWQNREKRFFKIVSLEDVH